MMLLTEKKTKEVKGRLVYRGDQTRHHFEKEDVKSPTVSQEALFLTAIIDAHERRDVGTGDVPNAFIQTDLKPKDPPTPEEGNKRMIMKITGVMVDMLVEIDPTEYGPKVVYENGKKKKIFRKKTGKYQKYELVTSHICRRSFATNYYGEINTSLLISATGHSTEVQFLRYVGKKSTQNAVLLANELNKIKI